MIGLIEVSNAIKARNEKLKTFNRTREILDEESLKRSKAQVQNLIKNKKKNSSLKIS